MLEMLKIYFIAIFLIPVAQLSYELYEIIDTDHPPESAMEKIATLDRQNEKLIAWLIELMSMIEEFEQTGLDYREIHLDAGKRAYQITKQCEVILKYYYQKPTLLSSETSGEEAIYQFYGQWLVKLVIYLDGILDAHNNIDLINDYGDGDIRPILNQIIADLSAQNYVPNIGIQEQLLNLQDDWLQGIQEMFRKYSS